VNQPIISHPKYLIPLAKDAMDMSKGTELREQAQRQFENWAPINLCTKKLYTPEEYLKRRGEL
jgi:hypothetical protein